jgi:hypothetical protein
VAAASHKTRFRVGHGRIRALHATYPAKHAMGSPCGIIPAKWTGVVVRSETPNMAAIVSTWHPSYRVVDHGRHGRYGHRTASMTWRSRFSGTHISELPSGAYTDCGCLLRPPWRSCDLLGHVVTVAPRVEAVWIG